MLMMSAEVATLGPLKRYFEIKVLTTEFLSMTSSTNKRFVT